MSLEYKDGKKKCSKCKEFREKNLFWKEKHTSDGLKPSCIDCQKKSINKERQAKNSKDWAIKNRDRVNTYRREYDKQRYANDISYRLKMLTKNAILSSIRKNKFISHPKAKLIKAVFDHLPYTGEQLRKHIESLWQPWMNWNNFGRYNSNYQTWQIDHIIPQSLLPFSDFSDENFNKLWSLSNLQPLETVANIKKRNKVIY